MMKIVIFIVIVLHGSVAVECSGWGVTGKQGVPSLRSMPPKIQLGVWGSAVKKLPQRGLG